VFARVLKILADHIAPMGIARYLQRWAFAVALAPAGLSLSCGSATSPSLGSGTNVVVATDTNDLSVVDPNQAKVIGFISPIPRLKNRGAMSADHTTFYLSAELDDPSKELIAIDTRSLTIPWRVLITQLDQQAQSDSIRVAIGGDIMAVTPDGTRLLLDATEEAGDGFVVVDLHTHAVTAFDPLVQIIDLGTAAPSNVLPNGAILVAGVRQIGPTLYTGLFYVLDGATLAVRDSVTVTPATDDPTGGMQQVLASPDGQHAYVVGFQQFRYDLASQRMTDSVTTPSFGWLSTSPDGNTLYRSDFGSFDTPGTGMLFVYGSNLAPRTPINVSQIAPSPSAEGQPVVTGNVMSSIDGKLLYVAAGTPRLGGSGVFEPARLLVLDSQTDALVKSVSVRGFSPFVEFVR